MDSTENSNRKVLVVEDSRPDRFRFRSILEMIGTDFNFAWNAKTQKVPEIDEIIILIEKVNPSILLLDLSWTIDDDRLLQKLLFKDKHEIEEIKQGIEKGNSHYNLKKWISGFRLLEKIKSEQESKQFKDLKIFVTTQYVPPVAYGLIKYLREEYHSVIKVIIHKWRDEKKLMSIISNINEDLVK